ncbi:hypothetical protein ACIBRY_30260 [Streptomyces anulatus]
MWLGRGTQSQAGALGRLDGFYETAAACERVVPGVGDGDLPIVGLAPGNRSRPFAGLVCEIAMGAVGGALNAALGPVLGDLAAGALSGAADAVSGGRATDAEPGGGPPDANDTGGFRPQPAERGDQQAGTATPVRRR